MPKRKKKTKTKRVQKKPWEEQPFKRSGYTYRFLQFPAGAKTFQLKTKAPRSVQGWWFNVPERDWTELYYDSFIGWPVKSGKSLAIGNSMLMLIFPNTYEVTDVTNPQPGHYVVHVARPSK